MAGELPGADAARRKKQTQASKRPLRWQDDKSTNKIYASGEISALGNNRTVGDSTLKPGQEPTAIPTPVLRTDDKSSDKYYANGGSQRVRGGAKPQPKAAAAAPQRATPKKPQAVRGRLSVQAKEEVPGVMDAVVAALSDGRTDVVVYVKTGDGQLLKRTRAALDLLVTREAITEEQYRDVRISYEPAAAAPVETPATTVRTEDAEKVDVDPLAFLNGEGDDPDDPVVDTSPVAPVEVDTTDDVTTTPDDDDDDNDFLKPEAAGATSTVIDEMTEFDPNTLPPTQEAVFTPDAAETSPEGFPPTAAEKPAEEAPKRRVKRSGRGAD